MKQTIYIFLHIPKTGGSTLIKNIVKNLKPEEILEINEETLGVTPNQTRDVYKKAIEKLIKKRKKLQKVKFVYGHLIPYGVHRYFKGEIRYITFLRRPAKRITSIYNYFYTQKESGLDEKLRKRFKKVFYVKSIPKSFKQWYENKFKSEKKDHILINTYYILKKLGYTDLRKFYFIGITKNFKNDSLFVYYLLGVKKFFFSDNISLKKYDIEKHPKMLKAIENDNPEAKRLFMEGVKLNRKFIKNHPEYLEAVRKEKVKRAFVMPFTQMVFDPRFIARRFRLKIRTLLQSH